MDIHPVLYRELQGSLEFFLDFTNLDPDSPGFGLTTDSTKNLKMASIAATGFALTAWVIASERGLLPPQRALDISRGTLRTLLRQVSHHRGFELAIRLLELALSVQARGCVRLTAHVPGRVPIRLVQRLQHEMATAIKERVLALRCVVVQLAVVPELIDLDVPALRVRWRLRGAVEVVSPYLDPTSGRRSPCIRLAYRGLAAPQSERRGEEETQGGGARERDVHEPFAALCRVAKARI